MLRNPFSRRVRRGLARGRRRNFRPHWDLFEDRTLLSTFVVTTVADNGDNSNPVAGSLRQAILDVDGDTSGTGTDTIEFDITGTGVHVIEPSANLPALPVPS